MKRTKIFTIALIISGLLISCDESFLNQQPVGVLSEDMVSNNDGINGLLVGAYSLLNGTGTQMINGPDGLVFSCIHSDESFKGSDLGDMAPFVEFSNFEVTTGNAQDLALWRHYFDGISRCNQILSLMPKATDITDAKKTLIEAECRFLRGHYYFYLKRAFKNIPWIDETSPDVRVPNTINNDGVTYVNIWPQIAADFDFARKNLPETQAEVGRPNKWAADCYYAKVLIYYTNQGEYPAGYAEALSILSNVIARGTTMSGTPYDLEANFHDNFNCLTENGKESVWAVQMAVNDGTPPSQSPNGDQKSVWISTYAMAGPGLGRGWGFFQPTPFYVDQFRTNENGLPYLDFYATNPKRLKDDYYLVGAPTPPAVDPFVIDTSGVDPRLDWTVSRRGIPLLDYGDFPGASWIRDQQSGGPYMSKKWYVLKTQDGIFTAGNNKVSAMNVQVIRFADVLLLAAECEVQAGSLDNARTLVNKVRQRMVSNSTSNQNWVKKANGTNAANYRINIYPKGGADDPFTTKASALNAILYERALELGTEGHRFWDVSRLGRGDIFNLFLATEKGRFDYLVGHYTEVPDRYLPIPRDAIDRSRVGGSNTLTQNPGY